MIEIEGFILAGGESSRMGADKAGLALGGETLVARVSRALATVARRVSVVSSREGHEGFSLPVVPDVHAGAGALGGLHAALAACRAPWALVVSCDLPFVTPELFARLASLARDDPEAVAPVQRDGRPQPLCALYAARACLAAAERLLAGGELRPRVLLRQVRTRWVSPEELSDLTRAEHFFTNVNTPAEYERAKAVVNHER
ncbi:MAG: molybdenum cofactor guanylyltransferase [Acidobacteria bacterium]|nr:molybdenum cofactor guanylyltransferase [Acidobacteriota bacterium]MCA1642860.1 molybdenum cofactor guanylyltransferase [Acidobacteriota bacterium]